MPELKKPPVPPVVTPPTVAQSNLVLGGVRCPNCSTHHFTYITPITYNRVSISQIQCGGCNAIYDWV